MIQVPPIVGTIITIAIYGSLFGAGLVMAFNAGRTLSLTANMPAWRKTMGRVVRSGVREAWIGRRRGYVPVIVYEYSAEGETYQSDRFSFAGPGSWFEDAESIANRHRVGADVTVHHHPVYHGEAFLQGGGRFTAVGELIGGVIGALFGALMVVYSFV